MGLKAGQLSLAFLQQQRAITLKENEKKPNQGEMLFEGGKTGSSKGSKQYTNDDTKASADYQKAMKKAAEKEAALLRKQNMEERLKAQQKAKQAQEESLRKITGEGPRTFKFFS